MPIRLSLVGSEMCIRDRDALIRLKNKLIRQGRYADIVDEVILLLVDAKIKRIRV